jgi:phytoene dehydrogenase-like protein
MNEELFGQLGWINGEIDKLFSNDMVVPPDSFFEKREFARAEVQNPFRIGEDTYFWKKLDDDSDFKQFLGTPIRFETAGASPLSPLVRYRQLAGWLFDCHAIEKGRDGLRDLLADQIVGQGGDKQASGHVAEIVVRKGRIQGVRLTGREELTGCKVILTEMSPKEIANLIPPNHWTKRFRAEVGDSPEAMLGYTLNLGVDPEVIPEGLADTAFMSLGSGIGDELLRIEKVPQNEKNKAALHVSCIVPMDDREKIVSGALRDTILDRLRLLIPFLDNYLRVIHSPFDGFGPLNLSGDTEGDAPPVPHAEEIPKWLHRPPLIDGILGIENLPHRTGIKGLLLAGSQVISGLGTEGEFLAAWGAARIAAKMDPRRERLVRSMRSKLEM